MRHACIVLALLLGLTTGAGAEVPLPPRLLAPERWPDDNLAIGYIGHASVLIKMTGTFILTDPAFGDRVGVAAGPLTIGPKRLVRPALPVERLPRLAAVLISHAHFDSLDLPSLRDLPRNTALIAPTGCNDLLGDLGFEDYRELAWGDRVALEGVTIEAVAVRHHGKRLPWGRRRGYNGYLLSKDGVHVLFAPDTAYTRTFGRFRREELPLTAAIVGVGAYDPWIKHHADPEQVWRMFQESGAQHLIPIHWDTFRLGKEPVGDAMRRLLAAAGSKADRIVIREIGGEWSWQHPAPQR
jgi:L-ascorbate metabolism protein UlaG (beta-lactamase superfamily)